MKTGKPCLVAFAGGKGGVGKTLCAANLALHVGRLRNVLVVDMDLGGGNLNASLGVRSTPRSIEDFIQGREKDFNALKVETCVPGLTLIGGSYTPIDRNALEPSQKEMLLRQFRSDQSDFVFLDLGAGTGRDTLEFFEAADVKVVVTTPESLALHNAFLFIKSIAYRSLAHSLEQTRFSRRLRQEIVQQLYAKGDQEISGAIDRIRRHSAKAAALVEQNLNRLNINVILNRIQNPAEERFVASLQRLSKRYANVDFAFWGSVPYDENVKKSVNDVRPFAVEYESSPANIAFRNLKLEIEKTIAPPESPASGGATSPEHSLVQRMLGFWGRRSASEETTRKIQPQQKPVAVPVTAAVADSIYEQEKHESIKEPDERDRQIEELEKRISDNEVVIAAFKKAEEEGATESQQALQDLTPAANATNRRDFSLRGTDLLRRRTSISN